MSGLVRRTLACVAIAALVTALTAVLAPAGWFERLDGVITDVAFPRGVADDGVAVVAIDARSLAEVDPSWPWSRDRYAEIVNQLGEAGAEVVALDIVLASPSPQDDALVAAMAEVPTVLASASGSSSSKPGEPVQVDTMVQPDPVLAAGAIAIGHAQVVADPADGVARAVPLVVESADRQIVPALSLAALAALDGVDPRPVLRRPSGLQVGDHYVPTDDRYRLRVSWPDGLPPTPDSPGPVLSAVDVLNGDFSDDDVAGRVVFVGVTDPTLGDQTATPVTKRTPDPGVMMQAAALHTMTSREFLVGPSITETLLWVALLSLLAALAAQFLPLPLAALSAIGLMGVALVVPVQRAASGTLLHSVYPALAVALAVPLSGGVRYLVETRLRRRVSTMFARYVPPPVAAEIVREGRLGDAVQGQRLEVSVFFCDLRGFTPLAASLEPAQVNQLLSHYYEYVSALVLAENGTIMQYVGDEVFAVFGAPLARADHAAAALRVALAVQAGRSRLESRLVEDGLPIVEFGIGINSGEVVAVHAGSTFRRQYAVVGDAVNVGSRLCSEARDGQVVASDSTVDAAAEPIGVDEAEPYHPDLKGVERDMVAWRFAPSRLDPEIGKRSGSSAV